MRRRKTDYGTILLHWLLAAAIGVALLTGLRIATEMPDRSWLNLLDALLPDAGVWVLHMQAALALVEKARYVPVKDDLVSLLSTPPCGLHVHVGVPYPETAVAVANAMRHHLPLLAALTANSPFSYGEDTGMASARARRIRCREAALKSPIGRSQVSSESPTSRASSSA